ncbi:MAG: acyl-CoA desaturase [Candidatus Obscuribacter sp.]|nr:acyl-CoA desaturase [Candidatus Obscuribacter sp.]
MNVADPIDLEVESEVVNPFRPPSHWGFTLRLPAWLGFLDSDYFPSGRTAVMNLPVKSRASRWFPFIFLHGFALLALFYKPSTFALSLAVFLYFFRMFAITAFFHRYFSHRTYKTSRPAQFLFAFWGGLAVQRGALWWASHHRNHHRYSDRDGDIHSPVKSGFIWSHLGWITADCNMPTRYETIGDFSRYPELVFLNRFDWLPPLFLGLGLYALGWFLELHFPSLATSGCELVLWGFFVSTVVLFHGVCSINSLSHILGSQRYRTDDSSKNNFLLALITLGEGWHNNHHRFPGAVRQGFFWWEVDMTYYLLLLFRALGLVWDLHPVPSAVYEERLSSAPSRVRS